MVRFTCPYCGHTEEKSAAWMAVHDRRAILCPACGQRIFRSVGRRLTILQAAVTLAAVFAGAAMAGAVRQAGGGTAVQLLCIVPALAVYGLAFGLLARWLTRDEVLRSRTERK
jgi:hypothetical protein